MISSLRRLLSRRGRDSCSRGVQESDSQPNASGGASTPRTTVSDHESPRVHCGEGSDLSQQESRSGSCGFLPPQDDKECKKKKTLPMQIDFSPLEFYPDHFAVDNCCPPPPPYTSKPGLGWEIAPEDIEFSEKILGGGSYGYVLSATYHNLQVAAKAMHPILHGSTRYATQFQNEIFTLKNIRHPNIVEFLGVCIRDNGPHLVMELVDGGSLYKLVNSIQKGSRVVSQRQKIRILLDISLALEYIHSHNIVHRDLSSSNVFLTTELRAKVGDFGVSQLSAVPCNQPCTLVPGNHLYMPPECFIPGSRFSHKGDIFSFAILAVELMTGKHPEPLEGEPNEMSEVDRRHRDLSEFCRKAPESLHELVMRGLCDSPHDRPTAKAINLELMQILDSLEEDSAEFQVEVQTSQTRRPQQASDMHRSASPLVLLSEQGKKGSVLCPENMLAVSHDNAIDAEGTQQGSGTTNDIKELFERSGFSSEKSQGSSKSVLSSEESQGSSRSVLVTGVKVIGTMPNIMKGTGEIGCDNAYDLSPDSSCVQESLGTITPETLASNQNSSPTETAPMENTPNTYPTTSADYPYTVPSSHETHFSGVMPLSLPCTINKHTPHKHSEWALDTCMMPPSSALPQGIRTWLSNECRCVSLMSSRLLLSYVARLELSYELLLCKAGPVSTATPLNHTSRTLLFLLDKILSYVACAAYIRCLCHAYLLKRSLCSSTSPLDVQCKNVLSTVYPATLSFTTPLLPSPSTHNHIPNVLLLSLLNETINEADVTVDIRLLCLTHVLKCALCSSELPLCPPLHCKEVVSTVNPIPVSCTTSPLQSLFTSTSFSGKPTTPLISSLPANNHISYGLFPPLDILVAEYVRRLCLNDTSKHALCSSELPPNESVHCKKVVSKVDRTPSSFTTPLLPSPSTHNHIPNVLLLSLLNETINEADVTTDIRWLCLTHVLKCALCSSELPLCPPLHCKEVVSTVNPIPVSCTTSPLQSLFTSTSFSGKPTTPLISSLPANNHISYGLLSLLDMLVAGYVRRFCLNDTSKHALCSSELPPNESVHCKKVVSNIDRTPSSFTTPLLPSPSTHNHIPNVLLLSLLNETINEADVTTDIHWLCLTHVLKRALCSSELPLCPPLHCREVVSTVNPIPVSCTTSPLQSLFTSTSFSGKPTTLLISSLPANNHISYGLLSLLDQLVAEYVRRLCLNDTSKHALCSSELPPNESVHCKKVVSTVKPTPVPIVISPLQFLSTYNRTLYVLLLSLLNELFSTVTMDIRWLIPCKATVPAKISRPVNPMQLGAVSTNAVKVTSKCYPGPCEIRHTLDRQGTRVHSLKKVNQISKQFAIITILYNHISAKQHSRVLACNTSFLDPLHDHSPHCMNMTPTVAPSFNVTTTVPVKKISTLPPPQPVHGTKCLTNWSIPGQSHEMLTCKTSAVECLPRSSGCSGTLPSANSLNQMDIIMALNNVTLTKQGQTQCLPQGPWKNIQPEDHAQCTSAIPNSRCMVIQPYAFTEIAKQSITQCVFDTRKHTHSFLMPGNKTSKLNWNAINQFGTLTIVRQIMIMLQCISHHTLKHSPSFQVPGHKTSTLSLIKVSNGCQHGVIYRVAFVGLRGTTAASEISIFSFLTWGNCTLIWRKKFKTRIMAPGQPNEHLPYKTSAIVCLLRSTWFSGAPETLPSSSSFNEMYCKIFDTSSIVQSLAPCEIAKSLPRLSGCSGGVSLYYWDETLPSVNSPNQMDIIMALSKVTLTKHGPTIIQLRAYLLTPTTERQIMIMMKCVFHHTHKHLPSFHMPGHKTSTLYLSRESQNWCLAYLHVRQKQSLSSEPVIYAGTLPSLLLQQLACKASKTLKSSLVMLSTLPISGNAWVHQRLLLALVCSKKSSDLSQYQSGHGIEVPSTLLNSLGMPGMLSLPVSFIDGEYGKNIDKGRTLPTHTLSHLEPPPPILTVPYYITTGNDHRPDLFRLDLREPVRYPQSKCIGGSGGSNAAGSGGVGSAGSGGGGSGGSGGGGSAGSGGGESSAGAGCPSSSGNAGRRDDDEDDDRNQRRGHQDNELDSEEEEEEEDETSNKWHSDRKTGPKSDLTNPNTDQVPISKSHSSDPQKSYNVQRTKYNNGVCFPPPPQPQEDSDKSSDSPLHKGPPKAVPDRAKKKHEPPPLLQQTGHSSQTAGQSALVVSASAEVPDHSHTSHTEEHLSLTSSSCSSTSTPSRQTEGHQYDLKSFRKNEEGDIATSVEDFLSAPIEEVRASKNTAGHASLLTSLTPLFLFFGKEHNSSSDDSEHFTPTQDHGEGADGQRTKYNDGVSFPPPPRPQEGSDKSSDSPPHKESPKAVPDRTKKKHKSPPLTGHSSQTAGQSALLISASAEVPDHSHTFHTEEHLSLTSNSTSTPSRQTEGHQYDLRSFRKNEEGDIATSVEDCLSAPIGASKNTAGHASLLTGRIPLFPFLGKEHSSSSGNSEHFTPTQDHSEGADACDEADSTSETEETGTEPTFESDNQEYDNNTAQPNTADHDKDEYDRDTCTCIDLEQAVECTDKGERNPQAHSEGADARDEASKKKETGTEPFERCNHKYEKSDDTQPNKADHNKDDYDKDLEQAVECTDEGEGNPSLTSHQPEPLPTMDHPPQAVCLLTSDDVDSEDEIRVSLGPPVTMTPTCAEPRWPQPETSDSFNCHPVQESHMPRVFQELRQNGILPVQSCHGVNGLPLERYLEQALHHGESNFIAEVLLHLVHCFRVCTLWNTPFLLDCSEVYVDVDTRELVMNACRCIQGPLHDGMPHSVCMETFIGRLQVVMYGLLTNVNLQCGTHASSNNCNIMICAGLLSRLIGIISRSSSCNNLIEALLTEIFQYI